MVDPVTRAISCSQQGAPVQSDASKVAAKGLGLTKGFIGQKNSFTVDCSKAGESEEKSLDPAGRGFITDQTLCI